MTKTATILRFQPDGPDGLEEWEQMDYTSLVSGAPVQHGHLYHEIEGRGYMAGIWDCTAFTDRMMPYSVDEYMLFLDGELTMVLPDGTEIEIRKGDAFIIPKGFECQWKQPGFVHKIFMILDGPVPKADNAALRRITVPDLEPAGEAPDVMSTRTDFINAAGTMRVEVQNFGALSQPALRMEANKVITVVDGILSLHDGAETHSFAKGETAYVHQGDTVGWTTEQGTRLIVASYADPGLAQFAEK